MIRPGALPLYQQILTAVFWPPVGTVVWWLMSRGWALTVQGGTVSERTKRRQKVEVWAVLVLGYVISFGVIIYAYFT